MKRYAYSDLKAWAQKPDDQRKPLIIEGARQTGKTWLATEFGKCEFKNIVTINFEDAEPIRSIFELDFDIDRIILAIQAYTQQTIMAGDTLIFFDEIQYARRGLLSLKYFKEKAPQYHVIAAGSLLGVIDHKDDSFPVGKVEFLRIYPLCFEEFLLAIGKEGMVNLLHSHDWPMIQAFEQQFAHYLRLYYYVGGMPEAVKTFSSTKDYKAVRAVHEQLLKSYHNDFSKHPPQEIVKRMRLLWQSIPQQLAKENKRFVYSAVRGSARAKDFETSIQWLQDAGIIYKVTRIVAGEIPLAGFEEPDSFKLYMLDIGLLGAMNNMSESTLIEGSKFFAQYKGALTEQFVLQEMQCAGFRPIHYWAPETGIAEIDFVIQHESSIIPIEVKAERNLRAKSLAAFISRYHSTLAIRTSLSSYQQGATVLDLPLYAISTLRAVLEQ